MMSSSNHSTNMPSKKPKITIIPPRALFIDLTQDVKTPSPQPQLSSPSAPNAPTKTPSTPTTSNNSINHVNIPPSSSSPNGYLISPLSPPPRVPPPPPTQTNQNLDITLSLSPITPLEAHFPSSPIPPPHFTHVFPWDLLESHGDSCLCCIHNRTLIFGLRDELEYMFFTIEHLLTQPPPPIIPSPQPSSPN